MKSHAGVVLALVLWSTMVSAAPKIFVDPSELDMGRVRQGESVEKDLEVRNVGDQPLVIDHLTSSCPCATFKALPPEASTIEPGGMRAITIKYTPDAREGDSGAAMVVYSNDPETPALVVDLKVFIEVLVSVRPPGGVHWGLAPRGFPLKKDLIIAPGDPANDITLLDIQCEQAGVIIHSEKLARPEARVLKITFDLAPETPLGPLATAVKARVRVGEEEADLLVPFKGEVLGDMFLSPPAIISPKTAYAQGQKISQITIQSSTGGAPPDVLGAMAVGPISAVISKNVDATQHTVAIHAAENAPPGPQSGTVYVMTTSADQPIVAVPIYFRMGSPVVFEPDQVVLHPGDHTPVQLKVSDAVRGALTIMNTRFEPDCIEVRLVRPQQTGPEEPAILAVQPAATPDPAKLTTILVVETDAPGAQALNVPILILPDGP